MKQLKMTVLAISVAAALGSSVAAQAEVVTVVSSGTIASGYDYTGIFGTVGGNLAGLGYTQTIWANLTPAYATDGNSHYTHWVNPDAATLFGRTTVGGVTYNWSVDHARVDVQLAKFQSDGFQSYSDQFYLGGGNFNNPPANGVTYFAENNVYSYSRPFVGSLSPSQQLVPSTNGLSFATSFLVQGGGLATSFTGSQNVSYVALNPVPEPESWAMLALGLGALGALARRRGRAVRVA